MDLAIKSKSVYFWLLDGTLGSGKTILMSKFLHEGFKDGGSVYANYKLRFNHVEVSDTKFHLQIPEDGLDKYIGLDEVGGGRQTVHEQETERLLILARKIFAPGAFQKAHIFFSSPHMAEMMTAIIRFTDYKITPIRLYVDRETGKPAKVDALFIPKVAFNPAKFEPIHSDRVKLMSFDVTGVCDLYETKDKPTYLAGGTWQEIREDVDLINQIKADGLMVQEIEEEISYKYRLPESRSNKYAKMLLKKLEREKDHKQARLKCL